MIDLTGAFAGLIAALDADETVFELVRHTEARHARHLAAIWGVALGSVIRATLFRADTSAVLVAVPGDRKIDAPRLRHVLGVSSLRVARGDRGIGSDGWLGMPGYGGAFPCLPRAFDASLVIDSELIRAGKVVVSIGAGHSLSVEAEEFARATAATVLSITGRTRLLAGGGFVIERRDATTP